MVFQGDRLPFQCSASYLGEDTRIRWYHNRAPLEGDEQAGVLLAESLVHDCTFITRYRPCYQRPLVPTLLTLWAQKMSWECVRRREERACVCFWKSRTTSQMAWIGE